MSKLIQTVQATAELYGKSMSEFSAEMLLTDLGDYPETVILAALSRCRKELRTFPTLAEIIARIDDGRPGPEEAWAMIPKDEYSSVVWNEEMQGAFNVVRLMIDDDPMAARMAFKETYSRLVTEARAIRKPVNWSPSLGFEKQGRVAALLDAVAKNRISIEFAKEQVPELEHKQGTGGLKRLGFGDLMKQLPKLN